MHEHSENIMPLAILHVGRDMKNIMNILNNAADTEGLNVTDYSDRSFMVARSFTAVAQFANKTLTAKCKRRVQLLKKFLSC